MKLVMIFVLLTLSALVQQSKPKFSETIYSTYHQIENAALNDPKLIFKLREAFHPVITERRWQVDGVQIVPFTLCVSFNSGYEAKLCGTNTTANRNTVYCEDFRWTNSYLLNLIPSELLLTMDSAVYLIIYSEIVRSIHSVFNNVKLSDIHVNSSCVPSYDDFLSASAIFLSWSKLYATDTSGRPTKWDSKYQGYIAKWYTYFEVDSYFHELVKNNKQIEYTRLGLWINFAFLNALIPVVFIKRRRQIFQAIALSKNKNILQRILLAISIFNAAYFIGMMVSQVKYNQRLIRKCYARKYEDIETAAPLLITFCRDVLGMLITKAIILPAALLIELITAIKMKLPCATHSCIALGQALALWQLFVFVQITLGLISIPLLIMILISPAESILIAGVLCTPFVLIILIVVVIPCTKSCKRTPKSHWITLLESSLVTCLVIFALLTYYNIVSSGAAMGTFKGYVLSLIPTIPISILVWMIKGKLAKHKVRDRRLKTVLHHRRESLSTEEEMIDMTDTPESADDAASD